MNSNIDCMIDVINARTISWTSPRSLTHSYIKNRYIPEIFPTSKSIKRLLPNFYWLLFSYERRGSIFVKAGIAWESAMQWHRLNLYYLIISVNCHYPIWISQQWSYEFSIDAIDCLMTCSSSPTPYGYCRKGNFPINIFALPYSTIWRWLSVFPVSTSQPWPRNMSVVLCRVVRKMLSEKAGKVFASHSVVGSCILQLLLFPGAVEEAKRCKNLVLCFRQLQRNVRH